MSDKTIGETLRDARVRQGLTLEDIERKTDIPSHHLLALELDQFYLIPDDKILKYIQRYGETVNLHPIALKQYYREQIQDSESKAAVPTETEDSETAVVSEEVIFQEVVENNDDEIEPSFDKEPTLEPEKQETFANRSRRHDDSYKAPSRWPIVLLSLVALLILIFVGYTVWHQLRGNQQTSQASKYWSVSSSSSQDETSLSTDSTASLSVEGSGNALTANLINASTPVEIVVSLSGAESTWFHVSNSGMNEDGITLNSATPSYTVTLPASTTTATIALSTIQGVTVTVDGQPLDTSELTGSDLSYITLNIQ